MKKTSIILIATLVVFCALVIVNPGTVGGFVYRSTILLESTIYGLDEEFVNVEGINISLYKNHNIKRPTIFMLHGFSADKDNWIRFAKYFDADFNLLIPDLAGHGKTDFDKEWDYSLPVQAERLLKLINHFQIEKVHIIGNSMGGGIAAHFAKNYPDRVLTLAMIDPAGVVAPKPSDMDIMLREGKNPFSIRDRDEFDSFYAMTMEHPPWAPDFVLQFIAERYQHRRSQLLRIFADFHAHYLLEDQLKTIQSPTLLIWGDQDRLLHVSSVDVWQAGIQNIETKIYTGIGHMAMMEIPEQSAQHYRKFIDAHTLRPHHL